MKDAPTGPGGTIVYFTCDDCGPAAARAAANGGHVVKPKFSIGAYGHIALVADPDGNIVGLHSQA
jgi:predicted enzyme related to lactoylglutathione lyase